MTYKKIEKKLDEQQETLHKIDKCVAVIMNDVKRINGTLIKHEIKNVEQDKTIEKLSKSVSNLKGKLALISAFIGAAAAWFFNMINKFRGGI